MPGLLLADICNRLDSHPAAGAWNGSAKPHFAVGSSALAGFRMAVAVLTTVRAELRFSGFKFHTGPSLSLLSGVICTSLTETTSCSNFWTLQSLSWDPLRYR